MQQGRNLSIAALAIAALIPPSGAALADAASNKALIDKINAQLSADGDQGWKQNLSISLAPTQQPVVEDGRRTDDARVIICRSEKIEAGANDWVNEGSVLNPAMTSVWPGALVYGDRNLASGTPTPITLPRAPVTVRVNLPGLSPGESTVEVKDPTNVRVKNAVETIVNTWLDTKSGKNAPALRVFSQSQKAYSEQQVGIDLGFSAQWTSGKVSTSFKANSSSKETVVLKLLRQVYYSVEVEEKGDSASFFPANLTITSQELNDKKPPVYVRSVDFGRLLIAQMRADEAVDEYIAEAAMEFAATGNKVSGEAKTRIENTAKNSQFRVVAIGGGAHEGGTQIFEGNFEGFGDAIRENFVFSKDSPALAVSYTVASLDRILRGMNATTTYVKNECQEYPNWSVELKSSGWFVSRFLVNYDVPDENDVLQSKKWESGDKTSPYQSGKIMIPGDARGIDIYGENYTGLVWDPVRTPLHATAADLDRGYNCFNLWNTTLDPKVERCDQAGN